MAWKDRTPVAVECGWRYPEFPNRSSHRTTAPHGESVCNQTFRIQNPLLLQNDTANLDTRNADDSWQYAPAWCAVTGGHRATTASDK